MTEVVRDLMLRGAIRRQMGWTLDKILATDGRAVLNAVYADVSEVAGGIAGELARGVGGMVGSAVQKGLGGLVEQFANAMAGKKR